MSGSNYNIPIFTVATESMGQIKWRTDSKVALALCRHTEIYKAMRVNKVKS